MVKCPRNSESCLALGSTCATAWTSRFNMIPCGSTSFQWQFAVQGPANWYWLAVVVSAQQNLLAMDQLHRDTPCDSGVVDIYIEESEDATMDRRFKRRTMLSVLVAQFKIECKTIPEPVSEFVSEVFCDSRCDAMSKRTYERNMHLARQLLRDFKAVLESWCLLRFMWHVGTWGIISHHGLIQFCSNAVCTAIVRLLALILGISSVDQAMMHQEDNDLLSSWEGILASFSATKWSTLKCKSLTLNKCSIYDRLRFWDCEYDSTQWFWLCRLCDTWLCDYVTRLMLHVTILSLCNVFVYV